MTRRDYIMLSTALRRAYVNQDVAGRVGVVAATLHIAHDLAIQSNGFDRGRFFEDVTAGGANIG